MADGLRDIEEAAAYLHISKKKLYALVAGREVPCTRIGRAVRFSREDLDAIVAQGKQPVIVHATRLQAVGPLGTHPPAGPSTPPPPSGPRKLRADLLRRGVA